MWSLVVPAASEILNDDGCLEWMTEDFSVEAFIPELAVESIPPGDVGRDVSSLNAFDFEPIFDGVSHELWAII